MSKDKLTQALEILRNAKVQMDKGLLISSGNTSLEKNSLITEVKKLIYETNLTGQHVNLTIQGSNKDLPSSISEAVYRLCQEAITNAIRHGKAEKVDIILRLLNTQLEIYIIDNGIGCPKIEKGFGLSGMEERIIKDLKGVLNFRSFDSGFTINAIVPLSSH